MSAWWLIVIVPVSASIGLFAAGMLNARSYDRGWHDGHGRGWDEGWTAGSAWDVTVTKTEMPS